MKSVLNFIVEYWPVIAWVLGIIAAFAGAVSTFGWQWVKAKAYALMLMAKKYAKDGVLKTGAEQEEFVVNGLYILLQKLKIPVSKEKLRPFVQKWYKKAMDLFDDGQLNNSYKV